MIIQARFLAVLGGLAIVVGCFLPWLSKGSYHDSGWEITSFGRPALVLSIGAVLSVFTFWVRLPWLRMPLIAMMALVIIANLWRGYKLEAISWGLFVCLLGFGIILWAAIRDSRE